MKIMHIIDKKKHKEHIKDFKLLFIETFNRDFEYLYGSYQLLSTKLSKVLEDTRYEKIVNEFMRSKIAISSNELTSTVEILNIALKRNNLKLSDLISIHNLLMDAHILMYTVRDYILDIQELYVIDELRKSK